MILITLAGKCLRFWKIKKQRLLCVPSIEQDFVLFSIEWKFSNLKKTPSHSLSTQKGLFKKRVKSFTVYASTHAWRHGPFLTDKSDVSTALQYRGRGHVFTGKLICYICLRLVAYGVLRIMGLFGGAGDGFEVGR